MKPRLDRLVLASLTPDLRMEIVVADDGVGLPEGFDPEACASVGMQVVCALVEQLDGTLDVSSRAGAQFRITFPADR